MEGESSTRKTERNFNYQVEQRQRAGLSCSVGSPTDPFYIRPRLSPHFVSVEAAVEVPRYGHLSASRYLERDPNSVDNWKLYYVGHRALEKVILDCCVWCLAELPGAKDAVSSQLVHSFFRRVERDRGCWPVSFNVEVEVWYSRLVGERNLFSIECEGNINLKISRSLLPGKIFSVPHLIILV